MILIKPFLFVILFSFIFLPACSNGNGSANNNTKNVAQKVKASNSEELDTRLQAFFAEHLATVVISDASCVDCNKKVVEVASKLLETQRFGVVLETGGGVFDISPLLKEELKQKVIFDHKHQLTKKFKLPKTFVLAKDANSDTGFSTTEINLNNKDQFEQILLSKLESK